MNVKVSTGTRTKDASLGLLRSLGAEKKQRAEFIPVYVVEGFLDAGKPSLLNTLLRRRLAGGDDLLLIQFEYGEEEPIDAPDGVGALDVLQFSVQEVQEDITEVSNQIYHYLLDHEPDQIWVEWNGVLPCAMLHTLFPPAVRVFTNTPGDFCQIEKVLHLADAEKVEMLMRQTGSVLPEQIAESDVVLLRNADTKACFKRLKRSIQAINPGVKVLPIKPLRAVEQMLERPSPKPGAVLLLGTVCTAVVYLLLQLGLGIWGVAPNPLDMLVNVFLGIVLQAVPFLLVGVLLSSAIQIFIPQKFIERYFPKHLAGGMLFAVAAGLCLPVCDCASIPVFRSLVRKGVPLSAAVTFVAVAPVINPVVMLSTWYAFHGELSFVLCRVGLGLLCAVLTGLTFARTELGKADMTDGVSASLCTCGCYNGTIPTGMPGKLLAYIRHAQSEFFSVGKYLLIGAFVSALFQTLGRDVDWGKGGSGLLLPLLIMMGMAFFLSLCSSSDAVVARSFAGQFPTGALMAFLVFGPMMDVKNLILLSGSFSPRFVARLTLTMFLICAVVVYLAFGFGLERILF